MGDYDDYGTLPVAGAAGTPMPAPPPPSGNISSYGPDMDARIREAEQRRDYYATRMGPQYDAYQKGATGVKDLLDKAILRLQTTPAFTPSPAETWGNIGHAFAQPAVHGGAFEALGNVGGAMADQLKNTRADEIKRQELLTKYGIEAGQMGLNSTMMGLNANRQEYDKANQQLTTLSIAAQNANRTNPKTLGITKNPDGTYSNSPTAERAVAGNAQAIAAGTSAGQQHRVKLSDGTEILIHGLAPNIGTEIPDRPGVSVVATHPVPPPHSGPSTVAAHAASVPQQPGQPPPDDPMLMAIFDGVADLPESIYNSPTTRPILENSAREAAQHIPLVQPPPQVPGHFGQDSGFVRKQNHNAALMETISKKYYGDNDQAEGVQDKMRAQLDELDSGNLSTGAVNQLKTPLMSALAGLGLLSDAERIRTATDQEFDKAALDVALHGLRDTFPGRVTNMEVDINRKANPNRALTVEAIRALLQMNIERAQSTTLKTHAWDWYQHQPDADAAEFKLWYDHYINPRTTSVARSRAMHYLQQMGLTVDPSTPDPTAVRAAPGGAGRPGAGGGAAGTPGGPPSGAPSPGGVPQRNPKYTGFTDQQLQDRIRALKEGATQ